MGAVSLPSGVRTLQLKDAHSAFMRKQRGKPIDPVLNSGQGRTEKQLAKVAGVGHGTIYKIETPKGCHNEQLRHCCALRRQ